MYVILIAQAGIKHTDIRIYTLTDQARLILSRITESSTSYKTLEFYVYQGQYKFRDWTDFSDTGWSSIENYEITGSSLVLYNFFGETYNFIK
jgi:hypothetical protein